MRKFDNSNKGRKNSYGPTVEYRKDWKVAGWTMSAAVPIWSICSHKYHQYQLYTYICIYSLSWFKVDLKDVMRWRLLPPNSGLQRISFEGHPAQMAFTHRKKLDEHKWGWSNTAEFVHVANEPKPTTLWGFPEMWVNGIFHNKNQPVWVHPHLWKPKCITRNVFFNNLPSLKVYGIGFTTKIV